jgi:hypothetical protein
VASVVTVGAVVAVGLVAALFILVKRQGASALVSAASTDLNYASMSENPLFNQASNSANPLYESSL